MSRLAPAVKRALSEERGIRARKAAEEELERFFNLIPDLVCIASTEGRFLKVNPAWQETLGYTQEEILSMPLLEQIHPDDRAATLKEMERQLAGKPTMQFTNRYRYRGGGYRWLEWKATPVVDGRLLFASARDITERKQMEDAIKEVSDRNRTIMETANDAIIYMNPDGTIQLWNRKAEEMFGYPAEEAIGRDLHQLIAPASYHEKGIEGLRQFAQAGTGPIVGKTLELTALRKGGAEFSIELSVSAMDIHGEWHATGIIRDITERKLAEARIQKLTLLYATLSQANMAIMHSANREELFLNICKSAVEHGKFLMAWIGLVDEVTHRVRPVLHYGAEQGYLEDIHISIDDIPAGRGPTGTSIRENRVCFINNFAVDERTQPWREAALRRGFHSSVGLPLRLNGRVIGALTVYSGEPGFFDTEQLDLMEEMSADISFALDGFEQEAQRRQAEAERETALTRLKKALGDSIRVAASIGEMRDPYTAGHQQRVSQLAAAIAEEIGLSAALIEGIRFGSLIHDVGKIGVPAEILSKPSRLMPLEMELIRTHPQAGYEIVRDIEFPWPVAQMVLQHHERLDGSGYPSGLKGDAILLEARIIAVADTIEAMSSHRPYRPGLGMEAALAEIVAGSGVRYDKQVVNACLRLIREKGFTFTT